jgi:serine/threonine-protein kinase
MATVYLAEDMKHHRMVALKVLTPEFAATLGAERFLREIATTAQFNHPHILQLYDSGEAAGFLYYVMPHVDGGSLRERLNREKQLPIDDALAIAREVADGLSFAHAQGVVHRDIKPENILLESGHAVIADFGIARAISRAGGDSLTQTGIAVGTPHYMSPEQAAGERDVDGRSDVYALACVLYEMLTGRPPFVGPTAESLMQQHLAAEAPPVTSIRRTVPDAVAVVLHRALAKSPADRFDPAAAFADALASGASGASPVTTAPWYRSPGWIVSVLAVATAIVATAVVLTIRTADTPAPLADRPMLAVLPFENLGESEDEYFAEGVTEEITSRLAEVSGLGVVSRTSALRHRRTTHSLQDIATELGVHYVLEGTIRTDRRAGDAGEVRVTPQLIRASDDTHLWTERYTARLEPGEIFEVQARIAEAVAAALDVTLLADDRTALQRQPTADPEALDAYLQGRFHWNRRTADDIQRAAQHFADATALDPQYADAHAGLADAYALFPFSQVPSLSRAEAYARAEAAARRALALDSTLTSAHASLGFALMHGKWEWDAAEQEFQRALAQDADHAKAHYWYAQLLYISGRFEEALAHANRAVALEPTAPITHHIRGWVLLCMERPDEAEHALRTVLQVEQGFLAAHLGLALLWLERDDSDAFVDEATAWGMSPEIARAVITVSRDSSQLSNVVRLVGESQRTGQPADPATAALVYMLIDAADSAVAWSERAVTERSEMFTTLIRLPMLREGFADPRVRDLVRQMGVDP